MSLHIFELIRVYLVCLRCNKFEKQFLQWWYEVDNNFFFFSKQIADQLIKLFFLDAYVQILPCCLLVWLLRSWNSFTEIIQGHSVANNIHTVHFVWMQISQVDFLTCCYSKISCLNCGMSTFPLHSRSTCSQSIQSFVYFAFTRFNKCREEQDLDLNKDQLIPWYGLSPDTLQASWLLRGEKKAWVVCS